MPFLFCQSSAITRPVKRGVKGVRFIGTAALPAVTLKEGARVVLDSG